MLACRKICFTFGSVPIYPWLGNISSVQDILYIKRRLLESLSGECVGKKQDSKQLGTCVMQCQKKVVIDLSDACVMCRCDRMGEKGGSESCFRMR